MHPGHVDAALSVSRRLHVAARDSNSTRSPQPPCGSASGAATSTSSASARSDAPRFAHEAEQLELHDDPERNQRDRLEQVRDVVRPVQRARHHVGGRDVHDRRGTRRSARCATIARSDAAYQMAAPMIAMAYDGDSAWWLNSTQNTSIDARNSTRNWRSVHAGAVAGRKRRQQDDHAGELHGPVRPVARPTRRGTAP